MASEQTDPLQPLPTVFESWMGNRITPTYAGIILPTEYYVYVKKGYPNRRISTGL